MYSFRHFRPQAARVLFDDDTCCRLEIETNAGIDEFCQPFGASCQKKKKKKIRSEASLKGGRKCLSQIELLG